MHAEASLLKPESYLIVQSKKYVEMIVSIMSWATSAPASACVKVSGHSKFDVELFPAPA